jgi:hypothetical protein
VFFGGINYQWNIKRDVNKPLNGRHFCRRGRCRRCVGINFGMGLGLNERSSFSIGYEHTWYRQKQAGWSRSRRHNRLPDGKPAAGLFLPPEQECLT